MESIDEFLIEGFFYSFFIYEFFFEFLIEGLNFKCLAHNKKKVRLMF